jgi:FkbM family methyltransferase
MSLFDIGSHFGVFTLAAIHYGGPSSFSLAVDPSPVCGRILSANVRLSKAEKQVQVLQGAMGSSKRDLAMLTTGPNGDHFFVVANSDRSDATYVPQYTLDQLADSSPSPPTHVKIDVEGFEYQVLAGGREFLASAQPIVFLELHCEILKQLGTAPQDVLELLHDFGYQRFERHGKLISRDEVVSLDTARLVCLPC